MSDPYARARDQMVDRQLEPSDIEDEGILRAMRKVPRHLFVPEESRHLAYGDHPVPVGHGQTISQPYIVALMIQLARVKPGDRVLDIGTGSGYQAAVLAEIGAQVFSIEVVPQLAERARMALSEAGYADVRTLIGDGRRGWPGEAPFDAILIAASPTEVPEALPAQLAIGGRLVLPIGDAWEQTLVVITRRGPDDYQREDNLKVLFVPLR